MIIHFYPMMIAIWLINTKGAAILYIIAAPLIGANLMTLMSE